MNGLLDKRFSVDEGNSLSFDRSLEWREERPIALLCFNPVNEMLSFVAGKILRKPEYQKPERRQFTRRNYVKTPFH
jgi:hypothetical protein